MAGWRQENWVLDFDGVRYEIESYVFFFFSASSNIQYSINVLKVFI